MDRLLPFPPGQTQRRSIQHDGPLLQGRTPWLSSMPWIPHRGSLPGWKRQRTWPRSRNPGSCLSPEIVVDGLGHADALHGKTHFLSDLGDLMSGVGGVTTAVIEEIADIMGAENLDQAFVFTPIFLDALSTCNGRNRSHRPAYASSRRSLSCSPGSYRSALRAKYR